MKRLGLIFGIMGTLLTGCGTDDGVNPLPGDVCARQHDETTGDGHDIVVCDELYAEAPYVHLPEAGDGHAYAGIVGKRFVTTSGATHSGGDIAAEDTRHGVALYDLTLDGDAVEDFRPVLVFDDALFLKPFQGHSFEGTISRGEGPNEYAFDPSLPVRVKILTDAPVKADDGMLEARAVIENLTEAVTASDGSCMPALSSYGTEAPFPEGTELEILVRRMPSMHEFGDDHFTMSFSDGNELQGSLMAPQWYRGPIDVVLGTHAPAGTYSGRGHGSPGSLPSVDLEPVSGGGDVCSAS